MRNYSSAPAPVSVRLSVEEKIMLYDLIGRLSVERGHQVSQREAIAHAIAVALSMCQTHKKAKKVKK